MMIFETIEKWTPNDREVDTIRLGKLDGELGVMISYREASIRHYHFFTITEEKAKEYEKMWVNTARDTILHDAYYEEKRTLNPYKIKFEEGESAMYKNKNTGAILSERDIRN